MALQQDEEEDEYTMIVERKDQLMVPPPSTKNEVPIPTLKKAHFLKPLLNPTNQTLPKFPHRSLSTNPNISRLTKRVHFKGSLKPLKGWKAWVESLQQTHQNLWRKLGVYDAIRASTYQINRHSELLIELAEKWCPETNTFIFPWGESTVTLEDVLILGGFPVLGVSVLSPFQNNKGSVEIESKLLDIRRETHCATHYGWMGRFRGKGGDFEHLGFLVLWLSRYVFSTNLYDVINQNVFGLAISLAKGVKIALAPAILGSIYRDLSLLKAKIGRDHEIEIDMIVLAPFQIVQLWFWERFPMLSPEPTTLMLGEPRLAQWHNVKCEKLQIGSLMEEIEASGNTFLWRPYALHLQNWEFPKFYSEIEMWVCINSDVDDELLSFAKCLRASELVGVDCWEQYLPHRVGMQFGIDQDIPESILRSNYKFDLAWISYMPLHGWKLYIPARPINGEVTVQYLNWWRAAAMVPSSSSSLSSTKLQISLQESGGITFICSHDKDSESESMSNFQNRSLKVRNESCEAPFEDVVIVDDDDDDDDGNYDCVSQFLSLVSCMEDRVSSLERNISMFK